MGSKRKGIKVFILTAVFAAAAILGAAFIGGHGSTLSPQEAVAAPAAVTQAASSEVCMVNDKVFGKPQIPVEFEGKTYYGCCEGCVKRINEDRTVRYSTDPLTGREVDKATAFIVEGAGGQALYFESVDTAMEFSLRRPGTERQ